MRDVFILGSTGSIGTQALEVIAQNSKRFCVRALSAGGANLALLASQAARFRPEIVAISQDRGEEFARALAAELPGGENYQPEILTGEDASARVAGKASREAVVLNGITGGVGLAPTLAALESGATLALANKESLIVGGALVKAACQRPGQIVPVDSEHSAIAQALASGVHHKGLTSENQDGCSEVSQIILTASGGPFRGKKRADLAQVSAQQALNHPTWSMGPVVTINSSTLVNKGLELIEAHLLFDVAPENIVPVIHPQSIIHSGVTWRDGATILQASPPDMRLPIALGLDWPTRLEKTVTPLDFTRAQQWTFEPVDHETFPAIQLARQAVATSASHPAVYNAANEVFVDAFLDGDLPYLQIVDSLAQVLGEHTGIDNPDLAQIMEAQTWAKGKAQQIVMNAR